MLKQQDLGHVLSNQNRSYLKFHSATTRREEKIRRFLEENLDAFLSIGKHAKPPKKHTRPPLRCFAYRKESECNLIVYT